MLEMYRNTSAVKTDNGSFPSAQATSNRPPPYSPHVSGVSCNSGENNVNSSDSLSQLLDKTNVFQIVWENAIRIEVLDGSGTLLLSVLRQRVSNSDWYSRTQYSFLNSTGKQVMEKTRVMEYGNDPEFNATCTVREGGRLVGFLTHEADYEMVGYKASGKDMFRARAAGTTWTVRRVDGKDLAVIATKDNPRSTSLVIFNQDEQLEAKALLLCSAIYYDALMRWAISDYYVSGGLRIVQRSQPSTSRNVQRKDRSLCIRGALDMTIRVFLVLILVILALFLPFILMKAT